MSASGHLSCGSGQCRDRMVGVSPPHHRLRSSAMRQLQGIAPPTSRAGFAARIHELQHRQAQPVAPSSPATAAAAASTSRYNAAGFVASGFGTSFSVASTIRRAFLPGDHEAGEVLTARAFRGRRAARMSSRHRRTQRRHVVARRAVLTRRPRVAGKIAANRAVRAGRVGRPENPCRRHPNAPLSTPGSTTATRSAGRIAMTDPRAPKLTTAAFDRNRAPVVLVPRPRATSASASRQMHQRLRARSSS